MKVALVYDRVNKWGGAERVLLALHELFPNAPLYTSVYNKNKAPWTDVFDVRTSFLQNFPFARHHELYATLMPLAFESFSFDEYDLVISLTSEAAKGIITKPQTLHICYCLTPTRYLWSGYKDYFRNPIFRFFSKPPVFYLKNWDKIAAQRPDYYLAISKEVQKRIKKYYRRDSEVIYPPVDIAAVWGPVAPSSHSMSSPSTSLGMRALNGTPSGRATPSSSYFLIVSRLVPYKKIDIAIRAFNRLGLPLKIVGKGSEERRLKKISNPNIEFLGHLTQEELVGYYKGCHALIFPGLEDFGLTVLEAQSFGKPVIAFSGGGALETIIEGRTGVFFRRQNAESLIEAIKQFNNLTINPNDCINQAKKFAKDVFKKKFIAKVEELMKKDKNL